MSKAVEAFRTISEVATDLDVPKHVLRFWEAKFPHIRPMKRGGGRRYYRPEDMELLRGIRHLLHAEGYTIKGVQKILREQGVEHVKQVSHDVTTTPAERPKKRGRRAAARLNEREKKATAKGQPSLAAISSAASQKKERRTQVETIISELEACRQLLTDDGNARETAPRARRAGSQRA